MSKNHKLRLKNSSLYFVFHKLILSTTWAVGTTGRMSNMCIDYIFVLSINLFGLVVL